MGFSVVWFLACLAGSAGALDLLQIVPGFTNSHVLFNYRLADSLTQFGHNVSLWTQMEMGMVVAGDLKLPETVNEVRVPIYFTDRLKAEGLKIFQTMMFEAGTAYELFITGQEFKDMRLEACEQMLSVEPDIANKLVVSKFDLAIGHFHDLCPLAMAHLANVGELIWLTHGTSLYDFTAIQYGLRTFPSFVAHPLSSFSDRMTFTERVINVLWHLSTLDFVNLPQNLLHEENDLYKERYKASGDADLWGLSDRVRVVLINGERFLDFPRPLPPGIIFLGQVSLSKPKPKQLPPDLARIVDQSRDLVLFSLGTVSNTTNMPSRMLHAFVEAFARFPNVTFLWRMEMPVPSAARFPNIHLLKWLPQKDLVAHPKTRLLIAHGGYNSLLEASQAGIPVVLMPLFADQFINVKRAQRFGIAAVLDKLDLSPEKVAAAIAQVLHNPAYGSRARRLAAQLGDKPAGPGSAIQHGLRLARFRRNHFALKAAQQLNLWQHFGLDIAAILVAFIVPVSWMCSL